MRLLIGFFGLNRSLSRTFASIDQNIFSVVQEAGIDYVKVGHFNRPDQIISPRSGEHGVKATDDGISLLNLELCWIQRQDDGLISREVEEVCKFPWLREPDVGMHMRRNALWQLHSLRQLGSLIGLIGGPIETFILLRPDLEYLDPLPIADIMDQIRDGCDLITPNWAQHEGLNDRFAVCSKRGLESYLSRMGKAGEFSKIYRYFHSEQLLSYVARTADLKLGFIAMRAARVRANGHVANEVF